MTYRLTNDASTDLINAYIEGVQLFGMAQAENYTAKLTRIFQTLADNPHIARERDEIDPPVRIHPCGAHLIVYRLEGPDVLIIRIRHAREDWSRNPE